MKLIQTEDGWVSDKSPKYRCSGIGCKEMPIKSIWIDATSIMDKSKKYRSLINVCQTHYNKQKNTNAILEENGKPLRDEF